MKIYFDATPSEIDLYREKYNRIGIEIEKLGHELTSRWILDFDESFFSTPRIEWQTHYKTIIDALEKSDVAIFDISVSSTSTGQLIQHALLHKKPVIAIKDSSTDNNIFLAGAGEVESKLLLIEYNNNSLEREIEQALNFVEDWLETRFTMILDAQTRNMLDNVTKTGKSRSDYIRELIKKDFEENLK